MRCPASAPCSPPCRRPGRRSPGLGLDPYRRAQQRHPSERRIVRLDEQLVDLGLLALQPLGQRVALGHGGRSLAEGRFPLVGGLGGEGLR